MNYVHPKRKTKVVFVQLGSPEAPTTKALRKYLRSFLGDPRVVDINPWLWKIILNFFVLPFRPKKSAKLYARIWDGESFPLITNTRDFTKNVSEELKKQGKKIDNLIITFHGMQKRRIVNKGDDYYRHCYETFCLITNNLKNIESNQCKMSFQSRFGSEGDPS